MSFEENQEKCIYCGSVNLRKTMLGGGQGGCAAIPFKENGKISMTKFARVYAVVCTDCGNISRLYTDEHGVQKIKECK
jgi:hypothetical protein